MSTRRNEDFYLSLPYRPGVGIMVLNKENKVFVGKRVDTKADAWQMPQGGIDNGESPLDAAMRELKEETGIAEVQIIEKSKIWFYYDLPDYLVDRIWDSKYRGQKQQWFLVRYEDDDSLININQSPQEFSDWKWVDVEELTSIIVPFKKRLYTDVIIEFKDVLDQIRFGK